MIPPHDSNQNMPQLCGEPRQSSSPILDPTMASFNNKRHVYLCTGANKGQYYICMYVQCASVNIPVLDACNYNRKSDVTITKHEHVGIPNFKVQNWAAKRFAQRGWRVGPGFWRNDPCHSSTRGVIWRFMTSWKQEGAILRIWIIPNLDTRYYLDNPRHSYFLCCSLSVSNQLMEYIFCKISLQARLWISFWALRFTTSNLFAGKTNAPTEFCKSSKLIQASVDKTARRPTKQPKQTRIKVLASSVSRLLLQQTVITWSRFARVVNIRLLASLNSLKTPLRTPRSPLDQIADRDSKQYWQY